MNSISERQNSDRNITRLAAQRQLYSEIGVLDSIAFIFAVIIPLVCTVVQEVFSDLEWIRNASCIISIVMLGISVSISSSRKQKRDLAASIQQEFDIDVFQMPWDNKLFGAQKDLNCEIVEKSTKILRNKGQSDKLKNWYSYVSSSSSRAFTVGNVFRETVAAKSPKICMLYGLILAKHIGEQNSDFTIDDIIVCNALENASDYDLDNFKELMELWINQEGIIEYPKEEKDKFEKTCLWCVYSRLFSIHGYTWAILAGEDDPESKTVKTNYIVDNSAKTLLNLISELGQIWNY